MIELWSNLEHYDFQLFWIKNISVRLKHVCYKLIPNNAEFTFMKKKIEKFFLLFSKKSTFLMYDPRILMVFISFLCIFL